MFIPQKATKESQQKKKKGYLLISTNRLKLNVKVIASTKFDH